MKAVENLLFALLEFLGLETAKLTLGDLFPGAILGLFPAALIGGAVSDWKHRQKSRFLSALPWDWAASLAAFLSTIYLWCLIFGR